MKKDIDLSNFENEISSIEQNSENIFKLCTAVITLCNATLSNLRKAILSEGFSDDISEIHFFKETKQLPLWNLIYYSEILALEVNYPKVNDDTKRKYLYKHVAKLNSFFVSHSDLVQYNILDHVHMDKQYYTRKYLGVLDFGQAHFYFQDPEFNTSHDRLFAQLKAYEQLAQYIQNRLFNLSYVPTTIEKNKLQWTSSKAALTELIYALYHSDALNNGTAGVKQIAREFQKIFNFDIGNYYHIYSEIRARKKSRVKFLDKLSITMLNQLDNGDI